MKLKGYMFFGENSIPYDITEASTNFNYNSYEEAKKVLDNVNGISGYLIILTDRK